MKAGGRIRPRLRRAAGSVFPLLAGLLGALLGALLATGCASVQEHRARQFASDWAALPPAVQARLRAATIRIGDRPRAVYFALGSPNFVGVPADAPEAWLWTYWGTVGEIREPSELQFISRGETRWPGTRDERVALRLRFESDALAAWTLGPIDSAGPRGHEAIDMGTFPRR